jgi:hypothetical protein
MSYAPKSAANPSARQNLSLFGTSSADLNLRPCGVEVRS